MIDPVDAALPEHERFLIELRRRHRPTVLAASRVVLGVECLTPFRRWRRWWMEPLLYTIDGRTNMFRSAFAFAIAELAGRPALGPTVSTTGEIAWSCALMLDDMLDHAREREGRPPAYIVYGSSRTAIAVWLGLWRVFKTLLLRAPVGPAGRLRMAWLSATLLARCGRTQLRSRAPADLAAFARHARDVNSCTHWSLLAPIVAAGVRSVLEPIQAYADAISVNGKMRNDLLDYCGGSTESVTVFSDFQARRVTFPICVFCLGRLSEEARTRVHRHFYEPAGDLTITELFALFDTYGTLDQCLRLMRRQATDAASALRRLEACRACPPSVLAVLEAWPRYQMQLAEQRVRSAVAGVSEDGARLS